MEWVTATTCLDFSGASLAVTVLAGWIAAVVVASLRTSDAAAVVATSADQSTSTPSTLVVVESSIRKFAREDVDGPHRASVICPSCRHLVPAAAAAEAAWSTRRSVPASRTSERASERQSPRADVARRVNLVARTINHPINATLRFRLSLCLAVVVYKDGRRAGEHPLWTV